MGSEDRLGVDTSIGSTAKFLSIVRETCFSERICPVLGVFQLPLFIGDSYPERISLPS
jgi:hypothetical protein